MAYYTKELFAENNDITLSTTTFPKITTVERWISEATDVIDRELGRNFDKDDYTETIGLTQSSDVFFISNPPINTPYPTTASINTTYSQFETDSFEDISVSVVDAKVGAVKVQTYQQWRTGGMLEITYNGGYDTVPSNVSELCRLLVQRKYIDTQIQQEAGDSTTTSIDTIRVSQNSASSQRLKLDRLDEQIKKAWEDLGVSGFIGIYEGMY